MGSSSLKAVAKGGTAGGTGGGEAKKAKRFGEEWFVWFFFFNPSMFALGFFELFVSFCWRWFKSLLASFWD